MPARPAASPADPNRALPARLWLCLHLPQLALDALGPWPPGASPGRWVWQAEAGGRRRSVLLADAAARAQGIAPGLRLASAQALAPQTEGRPRAPVAEAALLERLALSLGRLTPQVVIAPPELLLEIRASLRLFGGLRALLRRADALVRAGGATPRWSLAPTPLAASLLAHAPPRRRRCVQPATARRRLLALPLAALPRSLPQALPAADPASPDAPAATLPLLQALGLQRLGDLQGLPREGLRRRGAGPWLDALDRALGELPDPRPLHRPPEGFALGLELAWRADDAGALDAAAEPLLQALCGWLQRRALAAQRLRLELRHEYRARRALPPQVVALDLAQPSAEPATLRLLLREHLQRCTLQAPVDALRLVLEAALPAVARPGTLLPEAPDAPGTAQDLARLVDRLQARLGPARVRRLQAHPDARPEAADRWAPATGAAAAPPRAPSPAATALATAADQPDPAAHRPPRPCWLLAPPRPLELRHERPQLDGRALRLLGRAERIDTGWHDGRPVRRDYHLALAGDGRLCWIYLDLAPAEAAPPPSTAGDAPEPAPPRWFLHGLFG